MHRGDGFVHAGNFFFCIIQIEDFAVELKIEFVGNLPGGQNCFDARVFNAMIDQFIGQRVVQVDGNAFVQSEPQVNDRRANRWRDQHSDMVFIGV